MGKVFNVTGACNPKYHYMVNIEQRLQDIKQLVDAGNYFAINRARQYGKTTTLSALAEYLREEYIVVYLDFQMLGNEDFVSEAAFVSAFAKELLLEIAREDRVSEQMRRKLEAFTIPDKYSGRLSSLFLQLSEWCAQSRQAIVLMIDEVDSASNNQVFLDFLAQLRGYFLARTTKGRATFQSVILAGVYNIKNLKLKVNPDTEHKLNSPWNIATDFTLDMSFDRHGIAGMLLEYEADCHTGMDIDGMAQLLYDYTSGYPYLVSRLCKIMDEQLVVSAETGKKAWTKEVFLEAVRILLSENNSLFESLIHKLMDFPELKQMIHDLLFHGKDISNTVGLSAIENAVMFGFVKIEGGMVVIANRIFETLLYNLFLASPQLQQSELYKAALQNKNQFVQNGCLNMELVLEKFITYFDDLYGDLTLDFCEEEGRRYFLLFLRPIINGTGNYYIEARTRNLERTDVIVDYCGEQFVIEMKIWHGNAYNARGEKQLADYLDHYHLKKGYMLSFNFNKKKQVGIKQIKLGDKLLIEAVV